MVFWLVGHAELIWITIHLKELAASFFRVKVTCSEPQNKEAASSPKTSVIFTTSTQSDAQKTL
jgi:hypothetical protein